MINLSAILYFSFFCYSISIKDFNSSPTDSVFINWNKKTFESLKRQGEAESDSLQKALYKNRLSNFKGYLGIKNLEDVNKESIRYKFLNKLFSDKYNKIANFYVCEANRSGESVLLRNFVLYIDSTHTANIEFYTYVNKEWNKVGIARISNINISDSLKDFIVKFGKGFNHEEITITKFGNSTVKESEYYLYATLSIKSGIKDVLDSYRKENFIK